MLVHAGAPLFCFVLGSWEQQILIVKGLHVVDRCPWKDRSLTIPFHVTITMISIEVGHKFASIATRKISERHSTANERTKG
ncbi:hypothetical protein J6590_094383 [Homalodisca vitripennis]|nr:hypothetical protein J6590_094383 [Homalodisca vitripennis]